MILESFYENDGMINELHPENHVMNLEAHIENTGMILETQQENNVMNLKAQGETDGMILEPRGEINGLILEENGENDGMMLEPGDEIMNSEHNLVGRNYHQEAENQLRENSISQFVYIAFFIEIKVTCMITLMIGEKIDRLVQWEIAQLIGLKILGMNSNNFVQYTGQFQQITLKNMLMN